MGTKNHEARWKKGREEVLWEWQGNQVWLGVLNGVKETDSMERVRERKWK